MYRICSFLKIIAQFDQFASTKATGLKRELQGLRCLHYHTFVCYLLVQHFKFCYILFNSAKGVSQDKKKGTSQSQLP